MTFTCNLCGSDYTDQTYSRVHVCQRCFESAMYYKDGTLYVDSYPVAYIQDYNEGADIAQYIAWLYNNAKRK